MNFLYSPLLAVSWISIGFWWCVGSFLLGVVVGWLIWRHTAREVLELEQENAKAQKDAERRERMLASNRELLASLTDTDSNNA